MSEIKFTAFFLKQRCLCFFLNFPPVMAMTCRAICKVVTGGQHICTSVGDDAYVLVRFLYVDLLPDFTFKADATTFLIKIIVLITYRRTYFVLTAPFIREHNNGQHTKAHSTV